MGILKSLMVIFLFCILMGYCVQTIEVPEEEVKKDNLRSPKPDKTRIAVDYDWGNGRYIYQDEIHRLIKTGDGYIIKDSYKIPDYMEDSSIWEWQGEIKMEEGDIELYLD